MYPEIVLEICANSVNSALAAQKGGADRIELCDNLLEGGTTASYATITKARELLHIPLYPIIRPRGGDFLYDNVEFEIMQNDIQCCKQAGCDGIACGILTADGKVDMQRCAQLIELAWPLQITFHRAFDMTADPFEALENIIDLGCERILTSGRRNTAMEGAALIAQLIEKANDRIIIMAGAGVRLENIAALIEKTKAKEYHTTAKKIIQSKMKYKNLQAAMSDGSNEFDISITDAALVKKIKEEANSTWGKMIFQKR